MFSISVITICFNNLKDLIITCNSVNIQKVKPFQHIIIDGSTNSEIKNYLQNQTLPDYTEFVSEMDKGIADAFNKGVMLAKGEIIVMLNSGDAFYDSESLQIVTNNFKANPDIKWLHGKYKLIRAGIPVIIGKPFEKSKLYRGMRSVSHQTMFVKKELHDKYGLYDLNEKIAMDYDFLCRIANEPFTFINMALIQFAPGGVSSTQYLRSLEEGKRVYKKYYRNDFLLNAWQLRLKLLHFLIKSPVGKFLYKIKAKLKLENI